MVKELCESMQKLDNTATTLYMNLQNIELSSKGKQQAEWLEERIQAFMDGSLCSKSI
jgi:hypothetical protein